MTTENINIVKLVNGDELIAKMKPSDDENWMTITKPLKFSIDAKGNPTFVLWLISIDDELELNLDNVIGWVGEKNIPKELIAEYVKHTTSIQII